MLLKKHFSGAQKRKKRKQDDQLAESQMGVIYKFFGTSSNVGANEVQGQEPDHEQQEPDRGQQEPAIREEDLIPEIHITEDNTREENLHPSSDLENPNGDERDGSSLSIYDPRTWDNLDNSKRDILIEKGPVRELNLEFPKDAIGRHFSYAYYSKNLTNGESIDRKWLVYSKHVDKVYYFCCKLFKSNKSKSLLASDGARDWQRLSMRLKEHESSVEHLTNMNTWNEIRLRLNRNHTIDDEMQWEITKEKERWRQVVVRIVSAVKFLAKHNLAFRGSKAKLYQDNNGNFLGTVEMIAKFDLVMQEHIRRIHSNEIHRHYLGHNIQNELISIFADAVKEHILKRMLSISLYTSNLDLNVDDVRGQGYDNGSNMKGHNKDVQNCLLQINPKALYMPCACHSLNLTLCDMAKSCTKAISFFGVIQRIYALFARSTKRWKILHDNVTKLTVKPLSNTRWERDAMGVSDAQYLVSALENFEFLVGMINWHDILFTINTVSKKLQSKIGSSHIFKKYRHEGFESSIEVAKGIASDMDIEPKFPTKCQGKRKKHFDEIDDQDEEIQLLQATLPDGIISAPKIFRFVTTVDYYPNISTAYRILLTVPVTVVSAERSFSKLKLLKII
ncbi:hypothetical protein GQ55_3G410300 [Panicum hallii var. hallii]|uniref:HAT C-terminal dimerisation domain-containing protein n=1 Tax=Panicum hallii var. hallii TaxID=1504633 RepID=A0A2T7EH48_9POAL|nr:hypothetical protein GQ55_3G410300 [Panicum hallii var. hallii]